MQNGPAHDRVDVARPPRSVAISLRIGRNDVTSDADLEGAPSVRELRTRLHDLYGEAGRLRLTIRETHGEAVLEIPNDSAESGDR